MSAMMSGFVWAGTVVVAIWIGIGLSMLILRERAEEPMQKSAEQPKRPAIIWDELTIEERR